jgi:hypothetical protein
MAHCYFTRFNPKRISLLLGIQKNSKQKEFLKSREGFLRTALTEQGHHGPVGKVAIIALFNPCM